MSITRCGSARSSVICDDPTARIAAQLAYWQDALAGMPERLQLPTDRPYPPVADQRGANVAVEWPAELQQRVREVAGEHNATSFMVVQAALAVLLSKLSASSEVAVGFPIAGRGDPALDELVGFFVNTLVLRVDLAGDPTVAELLAQVRQRSLAAYEHQDVPFEVLVDRLNPTRSPGSSPAGSGGVGAGRTSADRTPIPPPCWRWVICRSPRCRSTPTPPVWIWRFRCPNAGPTLVSPPGSPGRWSFAPTSSTPASIEALIERLQRVLVAMTADPTQRLSSIDVLDADEHARLDEIGNRAVLTQPATAGVDSGAVRRAGGAHTRGGGGDLRGPVDDVPRAR